ncbi:MAG: sugar phosphate isomerase/epimerase [Roseiflexaceae bacterium]|nr:sugar phosphate isomerase/epimerase [Roseiflexaceae bacterium]
MLTDPLSAKPIEEVIAWAAANGVAALEINVNRGAHGGLLHADDARIERVQALVSQHGLHISSLACYTIIAGTTPGDAERSSRDLLDTVRLAGRMRVDTVCTLAGFAVQGKSKARTIAEDLPAAFRPVLDLAGEQGVRIALENWFATNLQHLDHFQAMFEALPDKHFGLNFDPSHLDWQGIDVVAAVREFKERIFHVHAKDVVIDEAQRLRVGSNGEGWWRYTLPGYGRIRWGEFITTLRQHGYDGVLSIEHEDSSFGAEEGFALAARYLGTLV